MFKYTGLASLLSLIGVYAVYKIYQEKKVVIFELCELEKLICFGENEVRRYQKISEQILLEKLKAHNKSLKLSEKLNNVIKNKKCTDMLVSCNVAYQLYQRAYKVRQSAFPLIS